MTKKQPKPLTTQKIQAVLRKADFLSFSAGGGKGYAVGPRPGITGQWIVEPLGMPLGEQQALLDSYTSALAAAGLNAAVEKIRWGAAVVVTDPSQFTCSR